MRRRPDFGGSLLGRRGRGRRPPFRFILWKPAILPGYRACESVTQPISSWRYEIVIESFNSSLRSTGSLVRHLPWQERAGATMWSLTPDQRRAVIMLPGGVLPAEIA